MFLAAAAGLAEAGPTRSDLDLLGDASTVAARSSPPTAVSRLRERLVAGHNAPISLGGYTVIRYLDSGATGDVFEVLLGQERLAMKVLREVGAQSLARFKREFRGAQGVAHRNVVTARELVAEDDEHFFTMEHVEGQSFLAHVRGDASREAGPTIQIDAELERARDAGAGENEHGPPTPSSAPNSPRPAPTFDEARLREALRQLALGIRAIHETGKLHLDLNPSNVKVTAQGRVVILDLGLIRDEPTEQRPDRPARACGTPPYMAPEQIDLEPGTASDWYAFGVMLFEALVGKTPFEEGGTHGVLDAKRTREAPRADALRAGLPEDLAELSAALLARDPATRPTGPEVIARLDGRAPRGVVRRLDGPSSGVDRPLVGRARELALLHEAFAGGARVVHLRGPDGCGKSALARRFLDGLEQRGEAQVLRGRCREQERLPFPGLDALVDALAPLLARLPATRLASLLPADLPELVRLFPILDDLGAPAPRHLPGQAMGERDRRALAALRALVLHLAASERVVFHLDDAERCDLESLRWLCALAEAEQRAPLVVFTYRCEALDASPALDELSRRRGAGGARDVLVGALDRSGAVAMARSRLPRDAQAQTIAEAIARESEGEAQLIEALARWASRSHERGAPLAVSEISLEALFEARVEALSEEARSLLSIVAVAARPLSEEAALSLVGTGRSADLAALRALRGARLLRRIRHRERPALDLTHERLRRVVLATIPPERRRRLHLALAYRLRDERPSDPEVVAAHFQAGGELDEARRHTELAAEQATRAQAFDRAAALCAQALTLHPRGRHLDRPLQIRRAEALASAGRRDEAVALYLACAEAAAAPIALDLQLRAAEQLFAGGDPAPGLFLLRPVLSARGVPFPESPTAAALSLAFHLAHLRLRGAAFSARGERRIPGDLRAKIDAAWSAGRALASTDALRAAIFLLEALHLAVDAGDAAHAAPGLAFAGTFLQRACGSTALAGALLARAEALSAELDAPSPILFTHTCLGVADLGAGRFQRARERLGDTLERGRAVGAACPWERSLCRSALLSSVFALGELAEHGGRARDWLGEARVAHDAHAEAAATVQVARSVLAAGDAKAARRLAETARRSASPAPLGPLVPSALLVEASCDLHEGKPEQAFVRLGPAMDPFLASSLLETQAARIDRASLRAAAALAAADQGASVAPRWLRAAEAAALELAAEDRPHAAGSAALIRAGVARLENQLGLSLAELRAAETCHAVAGMPLHVAACQRREGLLLGGRAGRALVDGADADLRARGIREPQRWMRQLGGLDR